jgi:CheY-like chemotaxis protein
MTRLLSESENVTPKQKNYLGILSECSIQLMELVNDILDFSKLTSGNLELHLHSFNLKNIIQKTVSILAQRAKDKNLKLNVDIGELPEMVTGDSRRIKQVLINLLSNAIKFTDKGKIELSVVSEPSDNQKIRIKFKVKDTGAGIKKENQVKIFSVFTKIQSDDFHTSNSPGAGLGLSISKELVRLMHGNISVDSNGEDNGSTFSFDILVDDDSKLEKELEKESSFLKNKKIIVVDDNEDNRIYLMDLLFSWGIQVFCFSSGKETLGYINLNQEFDIAIIDICMPSMGGVELAQNIRELGIKKPLIGLSSIGRDIQGKDWFDDFGTKPFSKSKLLDMITKCFHYETSSNSNKDSNSTSNSKSNSSNNKDIKILVAEDDYYNQILIKEMIKSLGYNNVTVVSNGKECIEEINKNNYDICLMDIKMPVMDGYEATRKIRKFNKDVKIIAQTAYALAGDREKALKAGCDDYIAKPIKKDGLLKIIQQLFNLKS